jgi:hypothetical protein
MSTWRKPEDNGCETDIITNYYWILWILCTIKCSKQNMAVLDKKALSPQVES